MNLLEKLSTIEQTICIQLLIGISMPMVAFLHRITTDAVNEYRKSIINKLEQKSLDLVPGL